MGEVQLRKTIGGYKRKDVTAYLESLVKKYEDLLEQERAETKAAKAEAEAAIRENAGLFEKVTALEAERDSVSRAVISAQREAEKILEEARQKGEAMILEKEQEVLKMEGNLVNLQAEIHSLRLSAAASLRKFEGTLASLVPNLSDAEE